MRCGVEPIIMDLRSSGGVFVFKNSTTARWAAHLKQFKQHVEQMRRHIHHLDGLIKGLHCREEGSEKDVRRS